MKVKIVVSYSGWERGVVAGKGHAGASRVIGRRLFSWVVFTRELALNKYFNMHICFLWLSATYILTIKSYNYKRVSKVKIKLIK